MSLRDENAALRKSLEKATAKARKREKELSLEAASAEEGRRAEWEAAQAYVHQGACALAAASAEIVKNSMEDLENKIEPQQGATRGLGCATLSFAPTPPPARGRLH